MTVINACNVQIMNANIGICRETNRNLYVPGVGSFAPKSTGDYAIHISRDEKPIKGSPFHIKVGDKELAHASKVKVSGPTTKAKANEPNILELDCSKAGRTKKSPALRYNNQWNFSKTCSENMLFYVCNFSFWLEFNYLFFTHCYETFTCTGYGGLSVVIEGPHRSEIECKHYENRKYKISYSPHEPGIYILNLRFADDHLPGNTIGRTFAI